MEPLAATAAGSIALLLQLGCEEECLDLALSLLAMRSPTSSRASGVVEQFRDVIVLARMQTADGAE